jgi:hypothetical protein
MSNAIKSWTPAAGLAVGAMAIAALVSCAKPVPTNRSVAPQEALDARAGWENSTKAILEIWQAEEAGYASALAARLKCAVEDLPHQKVANADKVTAAHAEVIAEFDEMGHAKYVALGADPRVVNQKVRQYYKDLRGTLPDGTSRTIEEITVAGRTMPPLFLAALRDAALSGRDPRADPSVQKIKSDYIAGRKAVADAIDAYLAQPATKS